MVIKMLVRQDFSAGGIMRKKYTNKLKMVLWISIVYVLPFINIAALAIVIAIGIRLQGDGDLK
jgi:hypothetical protein